MILSEYEKEVLQKMLESKFSKLEIDNIISNSSMISYDYTGVGYFLEISNELLPVKREVISEPSLIGEIDNLQVGFILFLENKTLTLECHHWGVADPPEDIRMMRLEIKTFENKL